MPQDILDTIIGPGAANPKAAAEHFQKGRAAEAEFDRYVAIEEFRLAVDLGTEPEYRFRLAYHLDLVGEEDEAIKIYEDLSADDTTAINALLNLAVLYEDRGEVAKAESSLHQILETDPNHPRARLYIKDVEASRNMYYDEEHARDQAKRNALLDTPVTDFELSVRARNCLKKMLIRTLGDLLKVTEVELLSYKNFGETSLTEIKHMLAVKGMRLGQGIEGRYNRVHDDRYQELKGKVNENTLNKSISILDLSVRARKALQMLNIQTIGDLAMRTEAELMGVKNFGATSLYEVKEKLTLHQLELRHLD